jgi:predicted DNA-binding transcriptional regulator YafY
VDPDVLTAVATTCRKHQRLRFDYRRHDGTTSVPVYVALFGFRFRIHQPPELIAHIQGLITRLTDAIDQRPDTE